MLSVLQQSAGTATIAFIGTGSNTAPEAAALYSADVVSKLGNEQLRDMQGFIQSDCFWTLAGGGGASDAQLSAVRGFLLQ